MPSIWVWLISAVIAAYLVLVRWFAIELINAPFQCTFCGFLVSQDKEFCPVCGRQISWFKEERQK